MLRFYRIPSDPKTREGYAFIFIETELGLFSTISDWGNYGYIWNAPGKEFREFLLDLKTDYLRSKLLQDQGHQTQVFDAEATRKAILEAIDKSAFSEVERQEEKEALDNRVPMEEDDYGAWQTETRLSEPWSLGVWSHNLQCTAFCEKVFMTKFKELLRAELAQEAGLCAFCKKNPVAYPGAIYCGAGCSARAEAHETPPTES